MKRQWNLAIYLGFLLILGSWISYYAVFYRYPITRDMPWLNFFLFAAGLALIGLGAWRAWRRPLMYRGRVSAPVFGALGVLIAGAFLLIVFVVARHLPPSKLAPAVGDRAPDFTLPDTNNHPVTLSKLLRRHKSGFVLLVFYRGYW